MSRTTLSLAAVAAASLILAACSADGNRPLPTAPSVFADLAVAPLTFSCRQNFAARPYAFFAASGTVTAGVPNGVVVYRPYLGDTVSTRATAALLSPGAYPGWPQFDVWDVTGGPASAGTDLYYLLLPKVLPPAGASFQAELHVLFDGGNAGWIQSTQDCTVTSGGGEPIIKPRGPFACSQPGGSRPYAIYDVKGTFVAGVPTGTVVYRRLIGDTLSRRAKAVLVSPANYPGWSQYTVWNVTGGMADASNTEFLLLLPKVFPGAGGTFSAELHVIFDHFNQGWLQSPQDCVRQ